MELLNLLLSSSRIWKTHALTTMGLPIHFLKLRLTRWPYRIRTTSNCSRISYSLRISVWEVAIRTYYATMPNSEFCNNHFFCTYNFISITFKNKVSSFFRCRGFLLQLESNCNIGFCVCANYWIFLFFDTSLIDYIQAIEPGKDDPQKTSKLQSFYAYRQCFIYPWNYFIPAIPN